MGLEEEQNRKEIKCTEERQERNSTRDKKENRGTKRKLENTDTSNKRKNQRMEHEESDKSWKEKFLIGSAEEINFTYVGLRIKSYKDGMTIDQNQYIAGLNLIPINKT